MILRKILDLFLLIGGLGSATYCAYIEAWWFILLVLLGFGLWILYLFVKIEKKDIQLEVAFSDIHTLENRLATYHDTQHRVSSMKKLYRINPVSK